MFDDTTDGELVTRAESDNISQKQLVHWSVARAKSAFVGGPLP